MTQRYRYFFVILVLALALSACASQPEAQVPSHPTLPSFPQEQTPAQQLSAAIGKTKAEVSYSIRYGSRVSSGEDRTEDADSQEVSPENPLDREAMYEKASFLPNRTDFLEAFCALPLRAIPSNTGVIRYEVSELSREAARELLYNDAPEWAAEEGLCSVCLEVDAAGRLSKFEITIETPLETMILFLELTFPESP